MLIRKFQEIDMEQVLVLCDDVREHHRRVLGGYFTPQDNEMERKQILGLAQSENAIILVAENEKEIVGFLLAEKKMTPWLEEPRIAHIHNFVVSENVRGLGIGKAMMDVFYRECAEQDIQEIKLGVFNKNKIAYNFYEKYGFEPQEQKMSLKIR